MAALKALVGIMGLMILVGFGALVYGMLNRLGDPAAGPLEGKIRLPSGARIQSVHTSGDLALLYLSESAERNYLIALDMRRGRLVSTLLLEEAEER